MTEKSVGMELISTYLSQDNLGQMNYCHPNYGDGGYKDGYSNGYSDKYQESR